MTTVKNIGELVTHGELQFPERIGLQYQYGTGGNYLSIKDIFLKGYSATQCACGDYVIPKGTVLKRIRYGNGYSFSSFKVVSIS